MLHPFTAYQELAREPDPGAWGLVRRPLFQACLLGAIASVGISGRLSLRLVLSTGAAWSFAPALQMASVLALRRALGGRHVSLPRSVDLYFMGQGPWCLWLLALTATQAFVPPERSVSLLAPQGPLLWTALLPLLWSPVLTFSFLRAAFQASRRRAAQGLLLHGAITWGFVLAFFQLSGQLAPRLAALLKE